MSINNNSNNEIRCPEHKKQCKIICYQCNQLLCTICLTDRFNEHRNHTIQHINNIKNNLLSRSSSSKRSINNSDDDDNNNNTADQYDINSKLLNVWISLKSLATRHQLLEFKESEIASYFRELHEYLVIEEHRLKKPIAHDLETIKQQIPKQINEMKSLVNIINTSNKQEMNKLKKDEHLVGEEEEEDQHQQQQDINYINTVQSTIESINQSDTMVEFIENNLLFKNDNDNLRGFYGNVDDPLEMTNILELVNKHFLQFKSVARQEQQQSQMFDEYRFTIKPFDKKQFSSIIKQSIQKTITQTYIFSGHQHRGVSLISLLDNSMIPINAESELFMTYNSFVAVDRHIYIFGGANQQNKATNQYSRFSLDLMCFDMLADIDGGVEGGRSISVCYDGSSHIYLVNGCTDVNNQVVRHHRIDRFNLNTHKFEKYYSFVASGSNHVLSFFFEGLLYSVPTTEQKLYIFNPVSKRLDTFSSERLFTRSFAACTDGNGNIYIHSTDMRFIRLNVTNKSVEYLAPAARFDSAIPMIYYQSKNESFIYFMGGKDIGNYRYTIASNKWKPFLKHDHSQRVACGGALILTL
ncbi:hypothetical protein PPL_02930 [Heterostelium album PN500]|uniref:B box-type domain-containing protein n=1 Tax=Heterostelium pallidum (strain ATCC 26659 / Pp 5 / PN500) TaxID=670386 RepID=D3B3G2_HETP5|nr:hypothetical protein PPL_02930 [Heterostelium album PN500]EFA83860.1 hypothetical protein PPL_02930 [Heterostelium album PN500]|eukprot:XP_020435977.1 hypothetical protein PPL_02930 [Heterostelium album PN500]